MNDGRFEKASPSDFWAIVFRHKRKLLLTPLCILLLATAVIIWAPRTYQSEAKLFLQVGRETVGLDPIATTGQTIGLHQNGRDAEVVSAIEILGSRGVIAQVVEELTPEYVLRGGPEAADSGPTAVVDGLMNPLSPLMSLAKNIDPVTPTEEAIIELEENLMIDSERNSTVLVVQMDAKTPEGAQTILAKLIEVYQREHLRIHRNPESQTFFANQRDLLERQLKEANQAVMEQKNAMDLASVESRRSTLESLLSDVENETFRVEQELATSDRRIAYLKTQLAALPERLVGSKRSIPNEGADMLRDQLYALQMREMDLKARYSESHPFVVAIAKQVEEAEKVVDAQSKQREETTQDINPIHRQLSLELEQLLNAKAGHEGRMKKLQSQKELVVADITRLNKNEIVLDDRQRQASLARDKFFKYANNLEQARIDQALENQKISSVSVAQAATLSHKPVSPSKLLVGIGALILAFGSTIAWVAACEQFNDKLRSGDDAERHLGLPVFAEIPRSNVHGRALNY